MEGVVRWPGAMCLKKSLIFKSKCWHGCTGVNRRGEVWIWMSSLFRYCIKSISPLGIWTSILHNLNDQYQRKTFFFLSLVSSSYFCKALQTTTEYTFSVIVALHQAMICQVFEWVFFSQKFDKYSFKMVSCTEHNEQWTGCLLVLNK